MDGRGNKEEVDNVGSGRDKVWNGNNEGDEDGNNDTEGD